MSKEIKNEKLLKQVNGGIIGGADGPTSIFTCTQGEKCQCNGTDEEIKNCKQDPSVICPYK